MPKKIWGLSSANEQTNVQITDRLSTFDAFLFSGLEEENGTEIQVLRVCDAPIYG
jgi:hypothetical protein